MIFASSSCGNKKTEEKESKIDTVWNDKVQDTFFGATFGDSASTVISKFSEHGFVYNLDISSDDLLRFEPLFRDFFSFGNITWRQLEAKIENGRFTAIAFVYGFNDKKIAMIKFNEIKNTISKKYAITPREISDTETIYSAYDIYGKNDVNAYIGCYRYETNVGEIKVAASLMYYDIKDFGGVSDEL